MTKSRIFKNLNLRREADRKSEAFIITVKVSERKASQRQREVYFYYILVMVTIWADKISKKNIAENPTEVSLKTPSDFQSPSNCQELQSSNEFDGNTISACFSNILEKFTIKQADIMGSFAEVLTKNQAKNINKISDEIGNKVETFNNSLSACKAKSSTGVATISINPNKTNATGAAAISVNHRNTSRANASVEDDGSSCCQKQATDTRKDKGKCVTNFNIIKKIVRETGDTHPPAEDELSLYGGSDLDEQIDRLVDTTNGQVNFANHNDESEPEESDEDDLIKDIANDFSAVEKTGPPIGKNLANMINNVMFNSVNRKKLVQKLEKHPRLENLYSIQMKKCNPEIWSEMLQSKTRSKDLKTQKMQGCILKTAGAISKVTNALLELKNSKNVNTTTLSKNLSTMVHDCTDSLALLHQVNTDPE